MRHAIVKTYTYRDGTTLRKTIFRGSKEVAEAAARTLNWNNCDILTNGRTTLYTVESR